MLSLLSSLTRRTPSVVMMMAGATTLNHPHQTLRMLQTSAVVERARKGTRERKRKIAVANKKKKEERLKKHPPPLPKKLVLLLKSMGFKSGKPLPLREDESEKTFASDDVYETYKYCYHRHEFAEAVSEVRHFYHESLLDRADDILHARIELDMRGGKPERFLDGFKKMVPLMHPFDETRISKNVCVFVDNEDEIKRAEEAGAFKAGGKSLIDDILKGKVDLTEIDHFVAHEDFFANLKPVLGMLREKAPKKVSGGGTVGDDVVKMVRTFRSGVLLEVEKMTPSLFVANQPDYGVCVAPLGRLSQDVAQLKENLDCYLQNLCEHRPKRTEKMGQDFVTRVKLELLDGPHYAHASIAHPLIDDAKLREHQQQIKDKEYESVKQ